jgi:hypothetical protein
MGFSRVCVCVVATALVMAGCVSRTADRAEQRPLTIPAPASRGDQVDPCSLTGPAAYEPHGTATMPGKPDLDRCRVSVATEEGRIFVWVGQQQTTDNLPEDRTEVADLGRGATVEQFGDDCDTALVFGETFAILATADPAGDQKPSADLLCALTSGAAEGVFNVLAGGRVEFWTPPANSLANLSACGVLPEPLVAEQLDVTTARTTSPPSNHWCNWGENDGNWATVRFPVAEPADLVRDVPAERIEGRESWVTEGGGPCTAYTRHIEFEPGAGTFEFAAVTVSLRDGGDSCAAARTLAAEAWANLPRS